MLISPETFILQFCSSLTSDALFPAYCNSTILVGITNTVFHRESALYLHLEKKIYWLPKSLKHYSSCICSVFFYQNLALCSRYCRVFISFSLPHNGCALPVAVPIFLFYNIPGKLVNKQELPSNTYCSFPWTKESKVRP